MLRNIIKKKSEDVSQLVNDIQRSKIVLLFDYQKLTVKDFTELRVQLRKFNSRIKLYANNIIKRAFLQINLKELADIINYPKALLLSNEEITEPLKILFYFSQKNKFLKIISGLIEQQIYSKDMINTLAVLPSKKELISILVFNLLMPIRELVIILEMCLSQKLKIEKKDN
ncbi:hypothetical protein DH96_01730 [Candidatus Phytoplasma oryzae]|uniref:Large ribosomal subunit protein uL10 n=1 Tax=Candidatus Phytoplasma oryzae TaxID=203274 RepID=A0A328IKG7_9MOLU|nr:50S ribosomal protein L10 [Candidatus Phytoplasma oryzae]RAM57800.1 hypothetical protein DH96_01730 [Candidatus Phytoplasma oryzae]